MSDKVLEQNLNDVVPPRPQMLIAQLLFSELPEKCTEKRARECFEKYAGEVGDNAGKDGFFLFPALRYKCVFEDAPEGMPPLAAFMPPAEFNMEADEMVLSQLWDLPGGAQFLQNEAKYEVVLYSTLSTALEYTEQAELFLAQLDAAVEMYPTARAVYTPTSGKLISTENFIEDRQWEPGGRFINTAVNARLFRIEDTGDMLVDTLGMYALGLPDMQLHFHSLDPNHVVSYVYNVLDYQFTNDFPVESGDKIDGFGADGNIDINIQWRAEYENSLIQPIRPVLDVNCGEFAAGER